MSFPNRLPSEGDGSTRRTQTIQLMAELLNDGWEFNELIQQLRFRGFRPQTAREYLETAEEMNKANWKSPPTRILTVQEAVKEEENEKEKKS